MTMCRMPRILVFASVVSLLCGCAADNPDDLARLAGWRGLSPTSADAFRFVIMSDRTGGHAPGKLAQFVEQVNLLKPDFVMSIGDIIEGYKSDEEVLRKQWQEADGHLSKLDAPFFYCAGNHDIMHAAARKVYDQLHLVNGRSYYSFDYRGCHFVVLDSTALIGRPLALAQAQWAWLAKDLADARRAEGIFIFMHHPVYMDMFGEAWPRLRKLLDPTKTFIFAGHAHNHSYDEEDGVPFLTLPATATNQDKCAYAVVTVDRGRPSVALVPLGAVKPQDADDARFNRQLKAVTKEVALIRSGDKAVAKLPNYTPEEATVLLTWSGPPDAFGGSLPESETLKIAAGRSAERSWTVRDLTRPGAAPVLTVRYDLTRLGKPVKRTMPRKLPTCLPVRLTASRLEKVVLDGKLDEWAGAPAHKTDGAARVIDKPEWWSGPEDCSMTTRIGYDRSNLYLAIDVTDDVLVGDRNVWRRDGIGIAWDPRPRQWRPADGRAGGECGNVLIGVPTDSDAAKIHCMSDIDIARGVKIACAARGGGYVMEVAIPLRLIATDFQITPGGTLLLDVSVNDRDSPTDRNAIGGMVLSSPPDGGAGTNGYAIVTFR